jgi:hypothetical protein
MKMRIDVPSRLGAVLFALPTLWLACQARVEAQVDESLVTRRWTTSNFWAETYDKPIQTARGHLEGTDEHIRIFHWYSEGRIKFDRKELDPPVWIGYRAFTISVDSDVEMFDHAFSDVALAVAVPLGSIGGDWSVIASAGAGTANDGRWDNLDALFPVATLEFTGKIDTATTLHVGLTLDGNRGVLPAFPLPYCMVEAVLGPNVKIVLGFPRTEIVLRPFDPMMVALQWKFPSDASARIEAELGGEFSIFAEASRRVDGFHLRHEDRTRIFFAMNTVEVGVRWKTSWMDVSLSAGYAFGQRFFTGEDLRSRTSGASVEDLPFIALTFPSTFWAAPFSSGEFE